MSGTTRGLPATASDPVTRIDRALASVEALFEEGTPDEVRRRARRRLVWSALLTPMVAYHVVDIGELLYGLMMIVVLVYVVTRDVRALRTGEQREEVDGAVLATRVLNTPWPEEAPDLTGNPRLLARLHDVVDRLEGTYRLPLARLLLRGIPWVFGGLALYLLATSVLAVTVGGPLGAFVWSTAVAAGSGGLAWVVHGRNRRHDQAVERLRELVGESARPERTD